MNETDSGYVILERLFERSEMLTALRELEPAAITRTKAGARHVLSVPVVRHLATDSRLIQLASRFVGPNAVPFRATLFDKSQISNWLILWHQDTALRLRHRIDSTEWGPWSMKSGVIYAHAPAWALASAEAAIFKPGIRGIYHVGDEQPVTLQKFLDEACRVWGYRRPMDPVCDDLRCGGALRMCRRDRGTPSPLTRDFVRLGRVSHWGDTRRARQELIPDLVYPTLERDFQLFDRRRCGAFLSLC